MKSTQTAETGEGNAPRYLTWGQRTGANVVSIVAAKRGAKLPANWIPAQSDKGEQCVVCGKDSWTCEHFDSREEAERNQ